MRRWRGIVFALVAVGSLAAVFSFRWWGKPTFFSTGPISQNHASFAHDCAVCHEGAQMDLTKALNAATLARLAKENPMDRWRQLRHWIGSPEAAAAGSVAAKSSPEHFTSLQGSSSKATSATRMDLACAKCHDAQRLHQPQAEVLARAGELHQIPVVGSGSCSSCHREHVSSGRMGSPGSESCNRCHNDPERLRRTLVNVPNPAGGHPPITSGLLRLLTSPSRSPSTVAFDSFAGEHPRFGYESTDSRDPGTLKFNHQRHFEADIPQLDGQRLNCATCHQPNPAGDFMKPVQYSTHCAACHTLQLDPALPSLLIPHGEAAQVRSFVRNLTTQLSEVGQRERGLRDRVQLGQFVVGEYRRLHARGLTTTEELGRRIFFTGDPVAGAGRISPKTNANQLITACSKCHKIEARDRELPVIHPTGQVNRWLTRGPFNHASHTHLDCAQCHDSEGSSLTMASKSSRTADILLPRKDLCIECHRPLQVANVQPIARHLTPEETGAALAAKQRREGGVREDCRSCHQFHAPAESAQFVHDVTSR